MPPSHDKKSASARNNQAGAAITPTTSYTNGRCGLQCLANQELLPPTGTVVICAPLKILSGSGSPLRVMALVPSVSAGGWLTDVGVRCAYPNNWLNYI